MRIPGGDDLKKATKGKNNMKTIYSITIFFSLLLAGCTSEPTLQKYFVENTENKRSR
jgi:PBP1b-binding outer membrane lipoprotein LpoB